MTRSQANRIEEIIRNQDVRDPRLTLDAIAAILAEKPSIKSEQSEPQTSAFAKMMKAITESGKVIPPPDAEMDVLVKRLLEVTEEAKKWHVGYDAHVAPDDVKNEFGNPVATFRIYNTKEMFADKLNVHVALDYCDAHLEPRHFKALKRTIKAFALEKVAELTAGLAADLEAGQ